MARSTLFFLWLAFATCASAPALADVGARGFVELRGAASLGVDGPALQLVQRARPSFRYDFSKRWTLAATVEASLSEGRTNQREIQRALQRSDLAGLLDAANCVWPEPTSELFGVDSVDDYLRVERLFLDAYTSWGDFRVGRQAVNWGSGFLVNPTDPFPEVLLVEPWRERAGVNALRATIPVGDSHQVQVLAGSNDTFTRARLAARATAGVGLTDLSVVGAYRQEAADGIVGIDVRGTAGVGFWVEGALHVGGYDPYEEVVVGLDYSFPVLENLIVTAQYYRNGAGSPDAALAAPGLSAGGFDPPQCDVPFPLDSEPDSSARFQPFFRGRDYAVAAVALNATPEISVNNLVVQNLGDGSAIWIPVVTWALGGQLEVSASGQVPFSTWGDGGELHPSAEDLQVPVEPTGLTLDVSGLVPTAVISVWSRYSF